LTPLLGGQFFVLISRYSKHKLRIRATSIHVALSILIAAAVSFLVFRIWYPWPYGSLANGKPLFFLIVSIDVVLGPLLTCIIFNPQKKFSSLMWDVTMIGLLQIGALVYGMNTLLAARPVYTVFEVDRFRVVSAADIDNASLKLALPEFQKLPFTGPKLIAARRAANGKEVLESVQLSLNGLDAAMQPNKWTPYADSISAVQIKSKSIVKLLQKYPEISNDIDAISKDTGVSIENMRFLPLTSRQANWSALLSAPKMQVIGYLPVDGFL
jgi:hypothetical protein